jgi:hypothetical protein
LRGPIINCPSNFLALGFAWQIWFIVAFSATPALQGRGEGGRKEGRNEEGKGGTVIQHAGAAKRHFFNPLHQQEEGGRREREDGGMAIGREDGGREEGVREEDVPWIDSIHWARIGTDRHRTHLVEECCGGEAQQVPGSSV